MDSHFMLVAWGKCAHPSVEAWLCHCSRHLDVGTDYVISVCRMNSVGCSETVSTSLGMFCTGG